MAPRRARTRSEVIVRDQIDRLLQILRIVNDVIRTAEGRLFSLFIPPPIFTGPIGDGPLWLIERESMNERANDRKNQIVASWVSPHYVWGTPDYEQVRTTFWPSWGTIQ